jgi:AcrR family transcriptional regulator
VREQLVDVAETLLSERGDAASVPVAEIVKRVGVTAPVLYQHFADKDALFVAVHSRRMNDFRETLRRAATKKDTPLVALEKRGRAYIRYATTKSDAYVALFMTPSSLGKDIFRDPAVRDLTAYDDLVANIQACIDAGEVPPGDADLLARVVWAQVHGLAALLIAMPEVADGVGKQRLVDRMMHAVTVSLMQP